MACFGRDFTPHSQLSRQPSGAHIWHLYVGQSVLECSRRVHRGLAGSRDPRMVIVDQVRRAAEGAAFSFAFNV